MIKRLFLILVIGALLSGCVSKGAGITGSYTHSYLGSHTEVHTFTFYDDGTFFYQSPKDTNSGVFKIQEKEVILTGTLLSKRFVILENGSLQGSDGEPWIKTK